MEFRYNVLDELAAYQKFCADNSLFLLLHDVSEFEMLQVMQRAQQQVAAGATNSSVSFSLSAASDPTETPALQALGSFNAHRSTTLGDGGLGPRPTLIQRSRSSIVRVEPFANAVEALDDEE